MVMNSSSRNGQAARLIVIHTAEGSRTVESLYTYFNGGVAASSHAGADGHKLTSPWVPDERAAWTLLNGNPYSFNLELCGFAGWSREKWLSEGWVSNPQGTGSVYSPRQMIRHAAQWVVQKRDAARRLWGIEIPLNRKLSPAEVGRGAAGLCGHSDYTYGTGDGDHTDPGSNFPWDVLLQDIAAIEGGGSTGGDGIDMTPNELRDAVHGALTDWNWGHRYGEGNRNLVDMENEQTTRLMSLDNRLSRTNELLERLVSALENPSPS
jgi:hypothetical protein